jgi:ferric-dicitrate binding protein FerR (iron transport regulator)
MQANDDYILLLGKRFSGDITPEQTILLEKWLAQSPDHAQLATDLQLVWDKTGGFGKVFDPDLDAAYRRIEAAVREDAGLHVRVVPLGARLLRIAAALALIVAAVWAYREYAVPVPTVHSYAENTDKQLITLPDGSKAWLRREAKLEYPAQFSGSERRVKLSGEAYFEVEHNPAHPFRVTLDNGGLVEVLGTRFNVRQNAREASVLVRDGKVRFRPAGQGGSFVLPAGRKAVFNKQNGETTEHYVQSYNELAWQTGGLEFVNTPVEKVIADLEQHFSVRIELRNPAMNTCPFSSPLTTQPLEKVLETLALTYHFRVANPAPGRYELSGGICQ